MPRYALQLTPNLVETACQMVGSENSDVFGDHTYMLFTIVSPTEFNLKLVTQDEIVEAAQADPELQIMSL